MAHAAYAGNTGSPDRARAAPPRPVSAEHARLVKRAYLRIAPAVGPFTALFLRRLGETAPELAPLFPGPAAARRKDLMAALGIAVAALDRFEDLAPSLRLLGAKYRAKGVREVHYGAVAEALLWTLGHSLGAQWTPQMRDAWTAVCAAIAETMTAAR